MSLSTVKPEDIAVQSRRFYRDGINSLQTGDIEGARPRFQGSRIDEPLGRPDIDREQRYGRNPIEPGARHASNLPSGRGPSVNSDNSFIQNQALFYGDDNPQEYIQSKPQAPTRNRASDFSNSQSRIFGGQNKQETDQWAKNQARFFADSQSNMKQYRSSPINHTPAGQYRSLPQHNTNPISQSNFYQNQEYAANQAKFFGDSRAEGLRGNDYSANQAKFFGDSRAEGLRGNDYSANQAKFFGDSRAEFNRNQQQGTYTNSNAAHRPNNEYERNQANFFGDSRGVFKPSQQLPPQAARTPRASQLPPRNPAHPSYPNNYTGAPGARPPLPPPNYGDNYQSAQGYIPEEHRRSTRHNSGTVEGYSNDYAMNQAKFFGDSQSRFRPNANPNSMEYEANQAKFFGVSNSHFRTNSNSNSNAYADNTAKFYGDSQSHFRKSGTLTSAARNFF